MNRLEPYLDMIQSKTLRKNIEFYMSLYEKEFETYPGSMSHHHPYRGGLMDHLIETLDLCLAIADHIESRYMLTVDRDTLVAATLIHDMAKIGMEYVETETFAFEYKKDRPRIAHGLYPIIDYGRKTGKALPYRVAMCIMGHMGGWAKTGVMPDSMEASILHAADLISARLGHGFWGEEE